MKYNCVKVKINKKKKFFSSKMVSFKPKKIIVVYREICEK